MRASGPLPHGDGFVAGGSSAGVPLLTVDEDSLPFRGRSVLQPHRRIWPGDEIPDRVAAVEGIEKIADFTASETTACWISGIAISPDLTQVRRVSIG
jgi:hypothetical protein